MSAGDEVAARPLGGDICLVLAELLGNVVSRLDGQGRIVYASGAARAVLGYEPDELIGKYGLELTHPDERDAQRASFTALLATGATSLPPITSRVQRKDGTFIHIETVCHVARDASGAIVEIHTAGRDVSERFETERVLKRSEASLRALLEALPEPVVVHYRGVVRTANRAFVALLGWDRVDELVGRNALDCVHVDDRAAVAARIGNMLQNRRTPEHRLLDRRGAAIPVEVTAVPFPFDGIVAVLVMVHDLRERKRLAAELAASDRLATVGRLAAAVGHEINNPLTYMLGSLELLRRDVAVLARGPVEAAALLAHVQHVFDGAIRVRDIARDLKSLSSSPDEPVEAVDLGRVLARAALSAAHEIDARARLVCEPVVVPFVMGNEGRLIQVFVNLLVNAAQAMPDGEVGANEIRVVTRNADPAHVTIDVIDNGRGFSPDEASRLFEPFFTTKSSVGSGLGLSIVRRIVTAFGGTVTAESRAPTGACFRVSLPVHPVACVADPAASPLAVSARRARILFADDEPLIRDVARAALDPHEVITVESGRAAIDVLGDGEPFDAVVCDLHMPDLGGIDIYEWIVANRPELAARVAFMTGGAFTERARRFVSTSSVRTLQKPFALDTLSQLVGSLLEWVKLPDRDP